MTLVIRNTRCLGRGGEGEKKYSGELILGCLHYINHVLFLQRKRMADVPHHTGYIAVSCFLFLCVLKKIVEILVWLNGGEHKVRKSAEKVRKKCE